MKYMRRTARYTWTDYKTNAQIAKELKITQILDKLLEYKRSWIQHVNRMPRNRLPRVTKHYCPTGRRNHGRPLKRTVGTWDRNGSTSGPTAWKIYDDDDDDYDEVNNLINFLFIHVLTRQLNPNTEIQLTKKNSQNLIRTRNNTIKIRNKMGFIIWMLAQQPTSIKSLYTQ